MEFIICLYYTTYFFFRQIINILCLFVYDVYLDKKLKNPFFILKYFQVFHKYIYYYIYHKK